MLDNMLRAVGCFCAGYSSTATIWLVVRGSAGCLTKVRKSRPQW